MLRTSDLFDAERLPEALRTLTSPDLPWEILEALDGFVGGLVASNAGTVHPTAVLEGNVVLGEGATIGPHAYVQGPAWIGDEAEIGHGAYVRGGCVIGAGAKVGHASEIKRSLLLPGAKAPHFNYVGDSILGADVNLGAGVKLANFKTDGGSIRVETEDTGLRKFGAAVGDGVSIGCNAVLAPGTVIGPRTIVYAGAVLRGEVRADAIVKNRPVLEIADRL